MCNPDRTNVTKYLEFDLRIGELQGTRVTVEFLEQGQSTEVILRHEWLPDTASYQSHERGWIGCLEVLAAHLA